MKTTLDFIDELIARSKRLAKVQGRPLRSLVEDGLRLVLAPRSNPHAYAMPDLREGDPQAPDPLERYSWPELRELIYGDPVALLPRDRDCSLFPELRTGDPFAAG